MNPALSITDVYVRLGERQVLNGLSLHLEQGRIRALVGLNGAGKTTALRVALGMLHPDAGEVEVMGQRLPSTARSVWRHVGSLVETPFCYPELTARENIEMSARLHEEVPEQAARRAEDLSRTLGLEEWLDTRAHRLSLGTRQKVGLVCALAHHPDLVVLDEPTNGLDPLSIVAFRDVLNDVVSRGGAALVTSHHLDEIARVASQVDVLHHGRVIDTITPDGRDLERVFFDTIVEADRAAQKGR